MNNSSSGLPARVAATPTVSDALAFVNRRRWLCLGIAAPIFVGAILLAYKLPPIYRSEASILIEQAAIPADIVASSVTGYIDEQIQVVTQRVLTPENTSILIDKYDLYPETQQAGNLSSTVQRFRDDFYLESVSAEVFDPRRGRSTNATFMFIVGFHNSNPKITRDVTSDLAQLYLDENTKSRREKATETTNFLEEEANRLAEEISEMEVRMAKFKDEYASALPDQNNLNIQSLDRVERELTQVEQDIRELRNRQQILLTEFRTINPFATVVSEDGEPVLSADQRLAELRSEYLELTSKYSAEHPDVIRTKRELEAILGGSTFEDTSDLESQMVALTSERDQLLDRYSNEHPDVVRLERKIDQLVDEIEARSDLSNQVAPRSRAPNNPTYIQAQVQIKTVADSLAAAEERRMRLIERRDRLDRNIAIAPRIEQEWLAINRGYNSARAEFDEIRRRTTEARLSERLETQNKGERFTLLSNASLPGDPIEPNRISIVLLGFVLSLGAGIGIAALVDAMDSTVHSPRDLNTHFGMRPLAVIPYVQTVHDRRVRLVRRTAVVGLMAISLAIVFVLI